MTYANFIGRTVAAIFVVLLFAGLGGCTNSSGPTCAVTSTPVAQAATAPTGANVITVNVNGCGNLASEPFPNSPCASITICGPTGSPCTTIPDMLLDTGSFGVRVFATPTGAASMASLSLTPVTCGSGGQLAECVSYGDLSSDWGPIYLADVQLGSEPAVEMPIQVINYSYATPPSPNCNGANGGTPDQSPGQAGINGIVGIGTQAQDCGSTCVNSTSTGLYYCCTGSNCSPTTVSLADQVVNPVAMQATDNNGVVFTLPPLSSDVSTGVTGTVTLGIGTEANNVPPSTVATLTAAYNGDWGQDLARTVFTAYSTSSVVSFIDSGSSELFIPPISSFSPICSDGTTYCPASTVTGQSAIQQSATSASVCTLINFSVAGAENISSADLAIDNLAGTSGSGADAYFDWGLPFFFGRTIYVGITGTKSSLGTGPYWAY